MSKLKKMSVCDDRGGIFEFMKTDFRYEQVNILITSKGSVRGGHYHKNMSEFFFVTKGSVDVSVKNINTNTVNNFIVNKFESFLVKPLNAHTLTFLEDSIVMVFYSHEFDKEDIYT